MQQRVTGLMIDALGPRALRYYEPHTTPADASAAVWPELAAGATSIFLHDRAATIYGGATEIQKNIIAKVAFGL
jgi:hypothetical protein